MNPVYLNHTSVVNPANELLRSEIENPLWFFLGNKKDGLDDFISIADTNSFIVLQDKTNSYELHYFESFNNQSRRYKFSIVNGMIELARGVTWYPSFKHFLDVEGLGTLHGVYSVENPPLKKFKTRVPDNCKSPRKIYAALPLPQVERSPTPTNLKLKNVSFQKPEKPVPFLPKKNDQ
ncbi:MAG: hypothetical protein JSS32_05730 [Verrucomicrobia bacterium]|nr:hypothetical protein [Verrucomicrobiota bacterium]